MACLVPGSFTLSLNSFILLCCLKIRVTILLSCFVLGDHTLLTKTLDSIKSALADMQGKLLEEVKHKLPLYSETCKRETSTDEGICYTLELIYFFCNFQHCISRSFSERRVK